MIQYRRLRAPAGDGQGLIEPPASEAAALLEQNARALRESEIIVAGRPLPALAAEARELLLQEAQRYTAAYRDVAPPSGIDRVLLAGHQPQLFHPGVLFKNFALADFAARLKATAVNLVIDNDAAAAPALRVPAGSPEEPRLESIPFDAPAAPVPYEERAIVDGGMFRSFGSRVQESLRPFVAEPVIDSLWPYAIDALVRTNNLGQALAQARHRLEGDWGLNTLELPLSQVCATPPFARFVASIVLDLPRFCDVHNQAVHEYRRAHRLRSRTHPVPELTADGEWREAPLWVWSSDSPARRRLFARRRSRREIELSDRGQWRFALPLSDSGDTDPAVEKLLDLPRQGVKLRTRALMTTLYARLFLGDLFLHGIGGAKYDELTDVLIRRFYGLTPPVFYAVTATLRLPVRRPAVSPEDVRRIDHLLRELRFHPEQHLDGEASAAAPHVEAKRRWIAKAPTAATARRRHGEIEEANVALQPFLEPQRRRLLQERDRLLEELRKERLLASREFSFCLFPQADLPHRLRQLLAE